MSFQTVAPPSDVASNGPRLMHDRLPSFPPGCSFTTGPLLPPVRCCPLWEGGVAELDTSSPSGRPPLALPVTVTTRGPRSGSQSSVPGHQLWWRVVPQLPYQPLWRDVGGGEVRKVSNQRLHCLPAWSSGVHCPAFRAQKECEPRGPTQTHLPGTHIQSTMPWRS